jgi:hypothetical protein
MHDPGTGGRDPEDDLASASATGKQAAIVNTALKRLEAK